MSKATEYWLWWVTDEFGHRRTSFRMSREEVLLKYPAAEPVAGTMEVRFLAKRSQMARATARVGPPRRLEGR